MLACALIQNMYEQMYKRGQWGQILSKLSGRSRHLLNLNEINGQGLVRSRTAGRLQAVSIRQIRGSEGRNRDFDRDFNPLQNHSRERWRSVALARYHDTPLPAVQLIQVGDVYFVRDGHHRISVALALGQQEIDAEVTVWQVNGPLPWDKVAAAPTAPAVNSQPDYQPAPLPSASGIGHQVNF